MFTVKATYRGETRKFSFLVDTFPSFEQLCNQLYRVFPISHNYYLSKLLFSPNATQGGRILIGREVHTREDYVKSIKPYKERIWPHGLLRFSVYDETPHKLPNKTLDSSFWPSFTPVARPSGLIAPPPAVPMPPVIQSTPSTSAMDVDNGVEGTKGKSAIFDSCCSVQSTKEDIQRLIADFKEDLDHVLKAGLLNRVSPASPPLSVLPLFPPSTSTANLRLNANNGTPALCSVCARQISTWNSCDQCHLVECDDCSGKTSSFCFGTMGGHRWNHHTAASLPPWLTTQETHQESTTTDSSISMPWSTTTDSNRNRNNVTPVPRPSMSIHTSSTHFERPVVHHGVICDSCENTIEGVRHKCLDCQDYDLCTLCINSGGTERHNPFHEFFEVATPGRVVVHRVYDRIPDAEQRGNATSEPVDIVSHHALCDLCDSQIRGDRYKCLACPDFDTCSNCFSITEAQHPGHGFVRLGRSEDYIRRSSAAEAPHYATCNICAKRVFGVRYKCMHSDCPDFDLCDDCEAHPIPLHPESHPLLKMKTLDTVIPQVCHHRLSPLLDLSTSETQPTDVAPRKTISPPEVTRNPFVWGFMHSTSPSNESCPETPVAQPALIPRLDEISPSVDRTVPAQEACPLPIPPELTEVRNSPPAVEVEDDDRPLTPLPVRARRACEDASQTLEETWPSFAADLSHLMGSRSVSVSHSFGKETPVPSAPTLSDVFECALAPSPLTGEETLLRPPSTEAASDMQQKSSQPVSMSRQTLAMLLTAGVESFSSVTSLEETKPSPSESPSLPSKPKTPQAVVVGLPITFIEPTEERKSVTPIPKAEPEPVEEEPVIVTMDEAKPKIYLSAMFVEDSIVSDGQVFPPGAEFMKCWRMLNDSEHDWPEKTQLMYVAGETLGVKKDGAVHVGAVKPGTEVELWTGELKAPDMAGRYVSYWRLRDGDGTLFGDSIWIDIVVADAHSSDESEKSIASSLVVMPHTLPSVGTASVVERQTEGQGAATMNGMGTPTLASLSLPSSSSAVGSDSDSEVSLVSIPSSDEGEIWEEVGSSVGGPPRERNVENQGQPIDYVLLYDDRSSEDE